KVDKIQVSAPQRHLAFVNQSGDTERAPNRMLEAGTDQDIIRRAEAVVLVAGEGGGAVDVRAAQRGLEIERHDVAAGNQRLRHQKANAEATFQVAGDGGAGMVGSALRALVGAVVIPGDQRAGPLVYRELVR